MQIRRVDGNEAVLLPPDQAYFLRENLRLRLLSARLALLAQDQAAFQADLEARGLPVFLVSAVSHEGLRELSFAMGRVVSEQRAATATPVTSAGKK